MKRDNLCFNFLAHHKVSHCASKFCCSNCQHKHHTSLCNWVIGRITSQHYKQFQIKVYKHLRQQQQLFTESLPSAQLLVHPLMLSRLHKEIQHKQVHISYLQQITLHPSVYLKPIVPVHSDTIKATATIFV